jgi:hypothetical protein
MNLLKALARLPEQEVRRLVKARKWVARREALESQAESLRKQLSRIEARLAKVSRRIGGRGSAAAAPAAKRGPGPGRRKGARRGRGGGPALKDILYATLKKWGRPAVSAELAAAALKAGYKTSSDDVTFKRAVHQALRSGTQFRKVSRGQFEAK